MIVWCGVVLLATARSGGQPPAGGHPFDGEWSLTFDAATPPGGVTLRDMYGSNSPYHMVFQASKRSFQVQADGTFTWRELNDGALKINSTANYFGTQTRIWESHRPLLKSSGQATAMPAPAGSPQAYDRSLQVDLDWTGGSGAYGDDHGGSGAYIVDAAGEQMTVTGGVTASTIPVTYWQAKWTLKPARAVREEISADEIQETTTYQGTRQSEVQTSVGKYQVTERIEVKHVRQMKLVPRG